MFNLSFPTNNINIDKNFMSKCPVCGAKQDFLEMSIIEDTNNDSFIYIKCKKCFVSFIGIVNFNPMGISIVSFATDLQKSEVIKFRKGDRVNEDDILDIHQVLKNKKIDFIKMMK
ncbi:MAG: hypothetical protein GWO87_01405 [Xanthomonadaceae bacterium]|nr:hypothetical protein [Rhodospirillaceae bacterium]NIA17833.1 hypothetical protein [Xanthomonadaceae bacterium]